MSLTPTRLRCEYRINPLGVDVLRPRLGWIVESPARGAAQGAFQVLVASTPEKLASADADLWDSGKILSDRTVQVGYAGRPLAARTFCHWKVRA